MAASVFNLVNNVAGAGMLALSASKAKGTGWIPSIAICMIFGAINSLTFVMVGEACELTKENDFKGLWARTLGAKSAVFVDMSIAALSLAVTVVFSIFLGDSFTPLLDVAGLPTRFNRRAWNIILLTFGAVLPMSLLKNLSALAFTSTLGFLSIVYTFFFIVIRAIDGTYALGSGRFVTDGTVKLLPSFERSTLWNMDFNSLVLASTLGLAYTAHSNAPGFYRELKNTNKERFSRMVNFSYFLLSILYTLVMAGGYATFGDMCQSNLLLNYHAEDVLAILGRLATGFSILFGYPLISFAARESLIGVAKSLGFPQLGSASFHFPLVFSILAFAVYISCNVKDVSLVVGLTGASMGSLISYVFPALIYIKAVELTKGTGSVAYQRARRTLFLVPFGVMVGALGVFMTLKS